MVERTMRGATSADVVEERSHRRALRCDTEWNKLNTLNHHLEWDKFVKHSLIPLQTVL